MEDFSNMAMIVISLSKYHLQGGKKEPGTMEGKKDDKYDKLRSKNKQRD